MILMKKILSGAEVAGLMVFAIADALRKEIWWVAANRFLGHMSRRFLSRRDGVMVASPESVRGWLPS
jgi:hypothetical protein